MRTVGSLVALLPLLAAAARAQVVIPDDVQASVRTRVDNGWNAGIVIGMVDGSGARYWAYGASARGGPAVNEHTVFEIGSITKVFTSLALAEMAVRGEVALDDPVQRLLPGSVRVPGRDSVQITLRHLASQLSALPSVPSNLAPRDSANPWADYDSTRLYAFLNGYALTRAPGERYAYSNLGVGLLGFALAGRAQTSYENLLLRRVIEPLGLASTRVTLGPELLRRLARGHAGGREVGNWDLDALAGAGALRSTASDMTRFLSAAMGLVRTPLDSAFRLTLVEQADAGPNMRIALGWHIMRRGETRIVWHNGGTGGYRSFAGFDPARRIGVVVLSNSMQSVDDLGFHLLDPTFPLMAVRTAVTLPPDSLDGYVGVYQLAPGFALNVRRSGDSLLMQATGQGTVAIYSSALDSFFLRVVEAQVTFRRDSSGRVTSLILRQNGRDIPAPRVP